MITRLEIENFKAIKHLAIDLDPLTVLVGPNDSGKSTILQALEFLSRLLYFPTRATGELGRETAIGGDPIELIHGGDRAKTIRLAVKSGGDGDADRPYRYQVQLGFVSGGFQIVEENLEGHPSEGYFEERSAKDSTVIASWRHAPMNELRDQLSSFTVALEPKQLATACRPDLAFQSNGLGLAALVDRILTDTDRSARDRYEDAMRSFSPHVATVGTRVGSNDGHLKEVVFGLRDKTRVPAREASAGLLATAGYLALLHLPARRFLIEEPENGLHPQALLQIVDVLRKLADDGRQVVMTTHSPVLLNYIDAANIRIVTRTAAEGVTVTPALESKVFNELKQKVDFGALWYSLGDDSLAARR